MKRSKLALVAAVLGALGVFDVLMGPALVQLGLVSPFFGFQWLFLLGLFEGLAALVLGLFALRTTRVGSGTTGRNLAWFGVASGITMVGILLLAAGPGRGLPQINDITTNLEDPPAFVSDPSDRGRDMAYPEDFVAQVRAAYPDLETQLTAAEPARALVLAEATAKKLGWEVVTVDAAAGTVLAREQTGIFQFIDDILIRIRPTDGGGSRIDVRSKSRDGRGDLGVNAARIRRYLGAYPR